LTDPRTVGRLKKSSNDWLRSRGPGFAAGGIRRLLEYDERYVWT